MHIVEAAVPEPTPRLLNRELSWMAFNERVAEEAHDPTVPLLERLKFLTIFHTNLDEFFMVRVSGIKQQILAKVDAVSEEGFSPRAQLTRIRNNLLPTLKSTEQLLTKHLLPALQRHGVSLVTYDSLSPAERTAWDDWYLRKVHPVLTPLAVGPTHPFPFISNLSLNLAVIVRSPSGESRVARVKIPAVLPQLVTLDDEPELPCQFMRLEHLIGANLDKLFPGMEIDRPWLFRVTRDADLAIKEDEANDLLRALEDELRKRRFGEATRLQVEKGMPTAILETLAKGLGLRDQEVYEVEGFIGVERLASLTELDLPDLKYAPYTPYTPRRLAESDIFSAIRQEDVLLHHPFESFGTVVQFLEAAADDPSVLAIKQTLYRTSGDSPVIGALERAIENGKQVAAVVELKARFDEENNIVWAKRLEEAGVHVIYGVTGIKVHSKLALVVRQEGEELRRYAHIGTGNYNSTTARFYTDLGLLTADPIVTSDVAEVFNQLTGFARRSQYRSLLVAPRWMLTPLIARIRQEVEHARSGKGGHIIIKCNSLTDAEVIDHLYEASNAGVRVDLLIRGICRLRPGVPGLSENISVRSVIGRFLEHSRVYWFGNGGSPMVYIGSADVMERNLRRRVEVLVPIRNNDHARWLREVLLQRYLHDSARSRIMQPDGTFVRITSPPDGLDVQASFLGVQS